MYIELTQENIAAIKRYAVNVCSFSMFGIGLELLTDHEETLNIFKSIHRKFIIPKLQNGDFTCYILNKSPYSNGPAVIIGNMLYTLPQHEDFLSWAELVLFQSMMDAMGDQLLLHAGVVTKNGDAYILYAPSGFGKTTLVLELVSRGYRFFSDEYCPVHLPDFTISAFPRMLGLRSDNPFYKKIKGKNNSFIKYENKYFVDCDDVFPGSTGAESQAKYLIVLSEQLGTENDEKSSNDFIDVVLFKENKQLLDDISEHAEVEVIEKMLRGFYVGYRLTLPKDKTIVKKLQTIWKRYQNDIFCVGITSDRKPEFSDMPLIEPMQKSETIFEVLTHIMNRAPAGKLMQRFQGKTSNLLLEVGNFVKDVKCYKMKPGALHKMADIIDSL